MANSKQQAGPSALAANRCERKEKNATSTRRGLRPEEPRLSRLRMGPVDDWGPAGFFRALPLV
ncbi:hypothetical protein M3Y99_01264200 [Aphelenchoides fujianensis]|nr:hypothetical protein M3Y99_01264200 [Aphelenchoides fujianensis]